MSSKTFSRVALSLLLAFPACAPSPDRSAATPGPPNLIVILADDLGYSDLGFLGSEIRTPNLDALSRDGVLFTNFLVSPACSPTRAMLLSGTDAHPAGLGTMAGEADHNQKDVPGYEGYLTDRVVTVATLLRRAGYHTSMAGKWHLGGRAHQRPHSRGFERSFALLPGGASHFSDATTLVESDSRAPYLEDDRPVRLPPDFFSSDFYTQKLMEYIEESLDTGRPFFAYAAYTAPHWPLQAPDEFIDRYRGVYDAGYDVLRSRRFRTLREQRIFSAETAEPPRLRFVRPWDELSPHEQRVEARKMEIYAAMVENLDHNIGRLVRFLKERGEYENTFVLFFSDNGPEGNPIGNMANNGEWIPRRFDNRYENLGRVNSYLYPGPGWSQASVTPFRLFKTFPTQGGVRVPAILKLPGRRAPGQRTHDPVTVKDVAPTLLELAGTPHPGDRYEGRSVAPCSGRSLLPFLRGEVSSSHGPDDMLVWELFGRRAVQKGNWKVLWLYEPYGRERWELYDLETDPSESRDRSEAHPTVKRALLRAWEEYAKKWGVVLPTRDMGYAKEEKVD